MCASYLCEAANDVGYHVSVRHNLFVITNKGKGAYILSPQTPIGGSHLMELEEQNVVLPAQLLFFVSDQCKTHLSTIVRC